MEEVEVTAIEQRLEPFAISKSRFCAFLIFSLRVERKNSLGIALLLYWRG